MSEGTTKPNGGREELKIEEVSQIERLLHRAEYNFVLDCLEAYFSNEKIQEGGANSSSSDSAKPTKAGDHTLATNSVIAAFKPLIPFIAAGAKAKLKDSRNKGKDSKNSKESRDEKYKEEK